jgi:hypothetical protein
MNEWKSWSKQFEKDMREAFASVRDAVAAGDPQVIGEGATDFARTIIECAAMPIIAFVGSLPGALDIASSSGKRNWARCDNWDDEG